MSKSVSKILFFLFLIVEMLSCGKVNENNLIEAIPDHNKLFLETQSWDAFQVFREKSNIIALPFFERVSSDWNDFSKYIETDSLNSYRFVASLLNISIDQAEFVYILDLENQIESISDILKDDIRHQKSNFNKIPIIHFKKEFSITQVNNLLIFSKYRQLVEDVLHHLENGNPITQMGVKSSSTDLSVFMIAEHLKDELFPDNAIKWMQLDLNLSDFSAFSGKMILEKEGSLQKNNNNFNQELFQLLPTNVAYFSTFSLSESMVEGLDNHVYAATRISPSNNKISFLIRKITNEEWYQAFISSLKSSQNSDDYNGFDLLKSSELFRQDLFFTDMNGYVVASQKKEYLKLWIDHFIAAQVCGNDIEFLKLASQFPENNFTDYVDFSHLAPYLLKDVESPDISFFLNKFSTLGKVIISKTKNKMGYSFKGVIQNRKVKSTSGNKMVWKTKFSKSIITKPFIVQNMDLNSYKILAQDSDNTLFCLDENGKKMWDLSLESKIISEIIPVDYYRDKSTFYIFNTKEKVHLISSTGEYLKGYPMMLNVKANVGMMVIDFDNENGIQYYLGCENGKIYGFDKFGAPLLGWNPCENDGNLLQPLKHFQSDTKDFIFGINENQEVRIYQKNGKARFDHHFKLDTTAIGCGFDSLDSKERIVAISKMGKVKVINSVGKSFGLSFSKNDVIDFLYFDFIGDTRKDFVILSKNKIEGYFYNGNKIEKAFSSKLKLNYSKLSQIKLSKFQKSSIGLFDPEKKRITIIDANGKQLPKFPIRATQLFDVVDLFQNQNPVLIGVYKNQIYAYQL